MHPLVSYNQQILPATDITIPATSSAALYGRGVFTTIAVYRSKAFLWDKHWRRLVEDAARTGIELSAFTSEKVKEALERLIEVNKLETARVRLTFFDTAPGAIWPAPSTENTSLLIQSADRHPVRANLNLTISPFSVNSGSPLAGVKSCNYLENVLALEKAKTERFDEAVRLNERGEVVSACLANLFWIKNRGIFTPDLETGCLAGTTRGFVFELAEKAGLPVVTVKADLAALLDSDEIFLTSSGIGITSVGRIGEKEFAHEISDHLKLLFDVELKA